MKTAKVWVVDVRVLWLHSAAWIAGLIFVAEQANFAGLTPFVFEVAGSRVADAVRARAKRLRMEANCMIAVMGARKAWR